MGLVRKIYMICKSAYPGSIPGVASKLKGAGSRHNRISSKELMRNLGLKKNLEDPRQGRRVLLWRALPGFLHGIPR